MCQVNACTMAGSLKDKSAASTTFLNNYIN